MVNEIRKEIRHEDKGAQSKSNKSVWVIGILIILVLIIGGYFMFSVERNEENVGEIIEVKLASGKDMVNSPIIIAKHKNFFYEEGIDLKNDNFATGKLSLENMLEGSSDISTVAPIPIVHNSFDNNNFKIIAEFTKSDDNDKIIYNKNSGINSAEDLNGKKVGLLSGTSAEFFLDVYLKSNGLDSSDVEIINIFPQELSDSLETGQADAVVIWEPHALNIQKSLGQEVSRLPAFPTIYTASFNIVSNNDFIMENPEGVDRFLKAIQRANDFIVENPEESKMIISNELGIDLDNVDELMNKFDYELSLSQATILILEDRARWLVEKGFTDATNVPNYLDYIYTDALDAVKPEAITIIR